MRIFSYKIHEKYAVLHIQYMINHLLIHLAQYIVHCAKSLALSSLLSARTTTSSDVKVLKGKNEWRFLKILGSHMRVFALMPKPPYYLLPSLLRAAAHMP